MRRSPVLVGLTVAALLCSAGSAAGTTPARTPAWHQVDRVTHAKRTWVLYERRGGSNRFCQVVTVVASGRVPHPKTRALEAQKTCSPLPGVTSGGATQDPIQITQGNAQDANPYLSGKTLTTARRITVQGPNGLTVSRALPRSRSFIVVQDERVQPNEVLAHDGAGMVVAHCGIDWRDALTPTEHDCSPPRPL